MLADFSIFFRCYPELLHYTAAILTTQDEIGKVKLNRWKQDI